MATTYQNTPLQGIQVPTQVGTNIVPFRFAITAAFVINDLVNLVQIPNFSMVYGFYLDLPSLDSSTGIVSSLGDNVSSSLGGVGAGGYLTGLILGRSSAGGIVGAAGTGAVSGAIPWRYNVLNANVPAVGIWLQFKVTTAATGTAATTGNISGYVAYSLFSTSNPGSGTGAGVGAL